MKTSLLPALAAVFAFAASPACACVTPVYQYALERWTPDYYEAIVVSRGPLSAEQQQLVKRMESPLAANGPTANVEVRTLDTAGTVPPEMTNMVEAAKGHGLPLILLRYPAHTGLEGVVWTGPLSPEAVDRLLDSPVRRQVAERIVKLDVAVWVLLESGNAGKDAAAEKDLKAILDALQKELKESDAQAPEEDVEPDPWSPVTALPKTYAFSVVRLSRTDPAEEVLRAMLLGSEPDLAAIRDEPIVFPVFARGRALCSFSGKGINKDNIAEACWFLNGPCACEVKAMNPGIDLVFAADWERAFEAVALAPDAAPELVSVMPASETGAVPAEATAAAALAAPVPAEAPTAPAPEAKPSPFLRSVALSAALALVLVLAASAVVIGRNRA